MQDNTYNYKVVRQFSIMAVVWGIVGMLVGLILAAQLIVQRITELFSAPLLAPMFDLDRHLVQVVARLRGAN